MGSSYPVLLLGSGGIISSSRVHLFGVVRPHPSLARLSRQRWFFPSASPASTNTAVIGSSFSCHTCSCSCHYSNRLLQHNILANVPKFSEYWTLLRVLSAEQWSLSMACHSYCTMNSTGLMCLNEFFSGWLWRCISVYSESFLSEWPLHLSLCRLSHDIFAHLVVIYWWCLATGSVCMYVGRSR